MKLPEIKKPDIKLPDFKLKRADDDEVESGKKSFKMPEFKKPDIRMPKAEFKLSESKMMKIWAGASVICVACSGIALVVAMF